MQITVAKMRQTVLESGQHLWIATDILRKNGVTNASSRSKQYGQAKRVLARLEKEGYLHKRFFPQVGITVYWVIP